MVRLSVRRARMLDELKEDAIVNKVGGRFKLRKALAFLLTAAILLGGSVAAYRAVAAGQAADKKDDTPNPADPAKQVGEARRFDGHTDWVYTVALSPDGRRALSGSSSE